MFITNPSLEQWIPEQLLAPEHKYWRGFILSTEGPWYLLSHRVVTEEGTYVQSIGLASEPILMEIAEQLGQDGVQSLCRLSSSFGGWALRQISEVWLAAEKEADETGLLLLKMKDECSLRDTLGQAVPARQGRRLLLRMHDERAADA